MRIRYLLMLITLLITQSCFISGVNHATSPVPTPYPSVTYDESRPSALPSAQRPDSSVRGATSPAVITLTPTGFEPTTLSITVDTAVTWHNTTSLPHSLQSGSANGFFKLYLPVILKNRGNVGGQAVDTALDSSETFSAILPPGGTFVYRFTRVGEYPYFLTTAPQFTGRVIVQKNDDDVPPDPADVAPPLDLSTVTDLAAATEFLYTGSHPIQTGVLSGTIEARRVAVLRGKVLTRSGAPLPGVSITVLHHPEFGQTLSRADGMFDLAVNGGGLLTINYQKDGYLPAQRQTQVPWQEYVWLNHVVLIQQDTQVTTIDLTANVPMQVARGSVISDTDGLRQETLLFSQGTQAVLTLPSGVTQTLTTLHVRSTEYTVGAGGSQAMPAELPANSAYTYATEFSVDEAVAAGATNVTFSQPVISYNENFLNFPIGISVPMGYYDRSRGVWVASVSGRVVRILSRAGGIAELDITGSGTGANPAELVALGVTDAERAKLASLYVAGQSLWRVPVGHFTPWDKNMGVSCQDPCQPPNQLPPSRPRVDNPTCQDGSIIECQNQTLAEVVPIAGTPFHLRYQSDRVAGRKADYSLRIPLSGATLLSTVKAIHLEIEVAGQKKTQLFEPPSTNLSYTFTWDGKDAYGRFWQGQHPITVRIGYAYPLVYEQTDRFGYNGNGIPITVGRGGMTLWQVWHGFVGAWQTPLEELGAWSLDVHHAYDPSGRVFYGGDGRRRSVQARDMVITTVAGPLALAQPNGVAVGPDGSLYVADANRIQQIRPDGTITTVAGTGERGYSGDGGRATQARLNDPHSVVLGRDGSLYIADTSNHSIRRVDPDGVITTVAGNGIAGYSGDGDWATRALLNRPEAVAVGSDGTLFIADSYNYRIRRVGVDGIITTVAGRGFIGYDNYHHGNGGPATQAGLIDPRAVAIGPDGSLFIGNGHVVRRVGPDGIISTVAGTGGLCPTRCYSGDGGPAVSAQLASADDIAVGADGSLYIADANQVIRQVNPNGIINTIVGNGSYGYSGDGGPATQARLHLPYGVALGPDSSLYIADTNNHRVRRIAPALPGFSVGDIVIPSEDASEVYIFSSGGRHLRTLNALTGAVVYSFADDGGGRLAIVTDGDGNPTKIERDAAGKPVAIVSPYGQRTELALNTAGYLSSITNPARERISFTYATDGVLTTLTDARGQVHRFGYDQGGRLTQDQDPANGVLALARIDQGRAYTVSLTTALSRTTTYRIEDLATGEERRVNTEPTGTQTQVRIGIDGSHRIADADGTVSSLLEAPDPRWAMRAPVPASMFITTPSGLASSLILNRTVTLADANNPLSLVTLSDTLAVNGHPYTRVYDAATRTFTETTPQGRQSITTVDAQGRVVREQEGDLLPASYSHDSRGRLITAVFGSGTEARITTFGYNNAGYLSTITDPLGHAISFGYDAAGRVTTQTQPDGRQIRYQYDANGNVTAIVPPGRPAHSFAYTPVDLPAAYTPPAVGASTNQTRYSYNADRQLTRITRPDGRSVDFSYDSGGRASTLSLARGAMNYSYHPTTGQLATLSSAGGITVTYGYDGALLANTTWAGSIAGSVNQRYDNNFRVTSLSVNNSVTTTLQYDNDGLLTRAGDLMLSRNPQNGLLTGAALGNVTDAWSHNGFGEPLGYSAAYNSANVFTVQYTRDKLGRIITKTETISGTTNVYGYTYDLAGRLIQVKQNDATIAAYTYDDNGNRLSYTRSSGTINGVYDAQDRLLRYGATAYTYTANGELLSKTSGSQATTYQYDELGNLMAVSLPNSTRIEYLVDGQNRRIGKKVNGILVQGFLYQGQLNPVVELDGAGNLVSRFIYASHDNVPDYMVKGGVTYRLIADHLGSPRLVVNAATGQIVQRIDYDAFGNVVSDTNPGFQPFGFAGGLYDQHTGLVRFGARDYDAEIGRWTARDPIGLAAGSNVYTYVEGDPVNKLDPEGMQTVYSRPDHYLSYHHIAHMGPGGYLASWILYPGYAAIDLERFGNLASGLFDTILKLPFTPNAWSLTSLLRRAFDVDDVVNTCSAPYKVGKIVGMVFNATRLYLRYSGPLYSTAPIPKAPNYYPAMRNLSSRQLYQYPK
jgi:RHS repeat-associated protein